MENAMQYMTVHEAAKLLRITPKQVRRRILSGKIRAIRPPGSRAWLIPTGRFFATINQGATA